MHKIIIGIFAHPDDEAFGPSGTLLLETRAGTTLHLVTLTAGEAGMNPDNVPDLHNTRLNEWRSAGALIGATSMHYLGYRDSQLCNQTLLEATGRIMELAQEVTKETSDATIEFMTIDLNGVTGHIDHIVAARTACLAFFRLKQQDQRYSRIRLACLSKHDVPDPTTDWIYMEAGHTPETIDEVVDARALRDDIITVMRTHHTQRQDGERAIAQAGDNLGMNYFIVKE